MPTLDDTRPMLTRRQALGLGVAGAAALDPSRAFAQAAAPGRKPNILWISCEDISPHLGCYGYPRAITPALDRFAEEGVRYTHAFTVAGVCAPSRSGIITGMYPTTLGTHHMRCQARLPDHVKCFPEYLRTEGYYCTNNVKTDYNFTPPGGAWHESSAQAHWRKRPKGAPFFSVFNFTLTHESRVEMRGAAHEKAVARLTASQRQDPSRLQLPPYYADTAETRRDWANVLELITALDYEVAGVLHQLEQDGLANDTIVFFWSDHGTGLPRAKRWLYDSGVRVPLLVRIPEGLRLAEQGRPGSVCTELVSLIDLAPTVLNLAGVPVPGHMQGRPFLGANLKPPRQYVYGARDRMDERYDIIRAVRDRRWRYVRNYENFKPYYQYMNTPEGGNTMRELRRLEAENNLPTAARRFMADRKPVEELYDVSADPHEIRNLAGSAAHRDVLERMRRAHLAWSDETRDLGMMPEGEIAVREEKLGSRWAILRQPGGPGLLARLRDTASLAGQGRASLPRMMSALRDADAGVRYWGAVGAGNARADSEAAVKALTAALKDESASVRVAAGRAMCLAGRAEQGLPVLTGILQSGAEWERLMAANALDELGETARPAAEILRAALKDANRYVARVVNRTLNVLEGTSREVR